jgi:hypothetical protein
MQLTHLLWPHVNIFDSPAHVEPTTPSSKAAGLQYCDQICLTTSPTDSQLGELYPVYERVIYLLPTYLPYDHGRILQHHRHTSMKSLTWPAGYIRTV